LSLLAIKNGHIHLIMNFTLFQLAMPHAALTLGFGPLDGIQAGSGKDPS
jgi:hypothetical protein